MFDFSSLPESFNDLCLNLPNGFSVSERVIDPVIIIDKVGSRIGAFLAASRIVNGTRQVYRAPSNRHAWVADGSILRPIPKDTISVFARRLCGVDPENLSYSDAIRLIRERGTDMDAESGDGFRKAGNVSIDDFDSKIIIAGLTATLFSYQARGVQWMWETVNHTGGLILADEMGLGKTLQIIALLLMEPPKDEAPALIVCPTSLIANWVREFSRFAPAMSIMIHRGPNRAGVFQGLQVASVVITTYDTMLNDISIFSSFEWSWLVCDEAQAIKNPESSRRKAIASIPRRRTIPMTGTPVENRLLDLWSIADVAVPGFLDTQSEFEMAYPDDLSSAQALGCLCESIILKRRVSDVAGDLPERIDIDIPLELSDSLVERYLDVRKSTIARYPTAGALVATLQLQLLCAHPWLIKNIESDLDGEHAPALPCDKFPLMTPKMERAIALIKEAFFSQKKVIVFALFNQVGNLLIKALEGMTAHWGAINGSTPQEQRQQIIDNFSSHIGAGCLVLNPKAAGAGLNITAATVVVHFTPVWNPALEAQASARAHRRGQTQPVTVYRLFYKDTVEEVMIERSNWKRELANESVPIATRDEADLQRALEISPKRYDQTIIQ